MADPLIASAFVKIKPEPTSVSGFGKDVRTKIEKSFTRPIKIKVEPTLLPYKQRIQKELSAPVFTIRVSPVLAPGFRSTVQKLVTAAVADVKVPTLRAITPAGRLPGAAANAITQRNAAKPAATSTAASREAAFRKELKKLTDQQTIAQKALTQAEQTQGTAKQRLGALSKAGAKAEAAYNAALKQQVALEGSLTQKQKGRLATLVGKAQAEMQAVATAKAAIQAEVQKAATDKAADAAAEARTSVETRLAAALRARTEIEKAGSLVTGRVAIARAELAATAAVEATAVKLASDAAALDTKAKTAESAILKKVTADFAAEAAAATLSAEANVGNAIAAERAAAAAAKQAAAQAQLTKGLLATALAAAGARGATLAASSEFLVGAAAATALFKSVQLAAQLEEELHVFQATVGATATEMDRVAEAAKRLGADVTLPAVSANEAAESMTELAKAGLSVKDSIDAARGVLQLGTAAQLDNATAVNITASALNAFGLAGTEAVHVADLLAGAANEAQGGIGDMGASLSSVASVARQAGVNIEDTVSLLTLLAKNGIQGSEAGTALRVAILRLIAPTKKAKDVLDDLGVSVLDAQGNMRPAIFNDIAEAVNELAPAQRNAALQTIYGTRAIRAQAVLGREGIVGLNNMRDATNQHGAAAKLAAARTAGFTGDIEALKNAAASLGLSIGEVLIPSLSKTVTQLAEITTGTFEAIEALRELKSALPGAEAIGGEGLTDIFSPGFDPGITDVGIKGIASRIKEVRAAGDLLQQGNLDDFFKDLATFSDFRLPSERVKDFEKEVIELTGKVDELALALKIPATALEKSLVKTPSGVEEIEIPTIPSGPVKAQIDYLTDLRKEITGSGEAADVARERIDALLRLTVALGRAPTALEIKVLFEKGSVSDEFLEAQRLLNQSKLNIQLGLDEKSLAFIGNSAADKAALWGQESAEKFSFWFKSGLTPLGPEVWDPWFLPAVQAAEKGGGEAAAAFSLSFATVLARQEAKGLSDAVRLAQLNALKAGAERRVAGAEAAYKRAPTKEHETALKFAYDRLNEINAEIKSITDAQATAAKEGADAIEKARNKADQDFLDAMGLKTGRAENAILRAEGTARLTDDIKTHTFMRDLLVRQRDAAAKTLKDAKLRAQTVQSLTADIIKENQEIAQLNRELVDSLSERFQPKVDIVSIIGGVTGLRKIYAAWIDALQKALAEATKGSKLAQDLKLKILQTQQAAFTAINEGFELDIQIAEAQERPRAEIRARERFIEQLRKEQDQFKRGSLEWKRLQLEIVNQQKAIDEVKGALKDRNDAFAQMSFEFLTTMQGFSANVMGNLLPLGAIGGTVAGKLAAAGGSSGDPLGGGTGRFQGRPGMGGDNTWPPGAAGGVGGKGAGGGPAAFLGESGRQSDAASAGGFTPSQAATLIALTRQIVILLGGMDKKAKHPESKRKQLTGSSSYDTQ